MDAVSLKRFRSAWELLLSYAFLVSAGLLLRSLPRPDLILSILALWGILFLASYLWGSYDLEVGPAYSLRLRTQAVFATTIISYYLVARFVFPWMVRFPVGYWLALLVYLNLISPLLGLVAGKLARVPALCVGTDLLEEDIARFSYWGYQCHTRISHEQLADWLRTHSNERNRLEGVEVVLIDLRRHNEEPAVLSLSRLYFCDFLAVHATGIGSYLTGKHCRKIAFMPLTGLNWRIKRLSDVILSIAALLLLAPLLLVIAAIIKLETRGPVFYKQRRIGKDMRYFWLYKFRTMYRDADQRLQRLLAENAALREEFQRTYKLKNDPRVTRFGRFLRKYSLDEIPQLFNVLRDQMSIVGPRPIVDGEIGFYRGCNFLPFRVNPGGTGLWQISGRNETTYERRVQLDIEYVTNWTYLRDIRIMLGTIPAVLSSRGAY